jgi:iron(III) transport system permease protein
MFATTRPSPLSLVAVVVALLIAIPIGAVLGSVFTPSTETWRHLVNTVLGDYVRNTLLLLIGVGLGVLLWRLYCLARHTYRFLAGKYSVGAGLAARHAGLRDRLCLHRRVQLPVLCKPGCALYSWNVHGYWFPEIRATRGDPDVLPGAIPLRLPHRSSSLQQTLDTLEAARLLGHGTWSSFFRLCWLARPGVVPV